MFQALGFICCGFIYFDHGFLRDRVPFKYLIAARPWVSNCVLLNFDSSRVKRGLLEHLPHRVMAFIGVKTHEELKQCLEQQVIYVCYLLLYTLFTFNNRSCCIKCHQCNCPVRQSKRLLLLIIFST